MTSQARAPPPGPADDGNPLTNDVLLQSEMVIEAQTRKIGQLRTRLKDAENRKARDNEGQRRRVRELEDANAQLRLEVDLLQGELVAQQPGSDGLSDEHAGRRGADGGVKGGAEGGAEGVGSGSVSVAELERRIERLEEENMRLKQELEGLLKITGGTSAATLALHESVTLEDRVIALQRRESELQISLQKLESMESCAQLATASLADSEFELAEARGRIAQQKAELSRLQELLTAASKEHAMVPPTVLVLRNEAEQMRRNAATTAEQDMEDMKNFLSQKSMAIAEAADKLDRILARTALGGAATFPGATLSGTNATVPPHRSTYTGNPQDGDPLPDGENVYTDLLLGLTGSVNHLSKTQQIELEKNKRLLNKISGTFLVMEVDHLKLMVLGEVIPENPADLISFTQKSIVDNSERFVPRILEINKEQLNLYNDSETQSPFAQIPSRDCIVAWDGGSAGNENDPDRSNSQMFALRFDRGPTLNHAECHAFRTRDVEDFRRIFHALLYAKALPEGATISRRRYLGDDATLGEADNHLCSLVFASHLDSSFRLRSFHLPTQRVVWQHGEENAVVFSPRKDPASVSEIILAENAILQIDQESFCLKIWCFPAPTAANPAPFPKANPNANANADAGLHPTDELCALVGVLFPPKVEGFIVNVSAAMKLKWRNCYIGEKGFTIPGEALHNGLDQLLRLLGQDVSQRLPLKTDAAFPAPTPHTPSDYAPTPTPTGTHTGTGTATAPAVFSLSPTVAPATPGLAAGLTPGMTVGVTAGASPALQRPAEPPFAAPPSAPDRVQPAEPFNCLRIHDGLCEIVPTPDALRPIAVLPAKASFAACDDASQRIVLTRLEGELMVEQFIFVFKKTGEGEGGSAGFYDVNKARLKEQGFFAALLPSGGVDMGAEVVCVERGSSLKVFSNFTTQFQPDLSCLASVHSAKILFDRQELEITEKGPADSTVKRIKLQAGSAPLFQRWCFALLLAGLVKDPLQLRHLGVDPVIVPPVNGGGSVPTSGDGGMVRGGSLESRMSGSRISGSRGTSGSQMSGSEASVVGVVPAVWAAGMRQYLFAVGDQKARRRSTLSGGKRYVFVHSDKLLVFSQSFPSVSRATSRPVFVAAADECRVSVNALDRRLCVHRFVGTGNEDLLEFIGNPAGEEDFQEQLLRELIKANFSITKINMPFTPPLSSLLPSNPTLTATARRLDVFPDKDKMVPHFSVSSDVYQASIVKVKGEEGGSPTPEKSVVRFEKRSETDPRISSDKERWKNATASFQEELNSSILKAEKRKFAMIFFVANFDTPVWVAEDHRRPSITYTLLRSLASPPPPLPLPPPTAAKAAAKAAAKGLLERDVAVSSGSLTSSAESFDLRTGKAAPAAKPTVGGKEKGVVDKYTAPPHPSAAPPSSVAEALALFLKLEQTPGMSEAQRAELAALRSYVHDAQDLDAATQFLNEARAIALIPTLQGQWDELERLVRAPREVGGDVVGGPGKPMKDMIPEACDRLAKIVKEGKYSGKVKEELAKVAIRVREFATKEGSLEERREVENLIAYARRLAESEQELRRAALRNGQDPDQAVAAAILNGRRAAELAGKNEGSLGAPSLLDLLERANKKNVPEDLTRATKASNAKFPNLYEYKTDLRDIINELTLRRKPNTAEEVIALRKDITDLHEYFFKDAPDLAKRIKNLHWAVKTKSPNPGEAKRLAQGAIDVLESAGVRTPEEEEQERAAREAAAKAAKEEAKQADMDDFFRNAGIAPPEGLTADGLWAKTDAELAAAEGAAAALEGAAGKARKSGRGAEEDARQRAAKAEGARRASQLEKARKSVAAGLRRRSLGHKRLGLERYELPPMPEELEVFEKRDRSKLASSDVVPSVAEKKARAVTRRDLKQPARVPPPRGSLLAPRSPLTRLQGDDAGVSEKTARRRASVATGLQALKELTKKFEQVNVERSEATGRPLPFARKRVLKNDDPSSKGPLPRGSVARASVADLTLASSALAKLAKDGLTSLAEGKRAKLGGTFVGGGRGKGGSTFVGGEKSGLSKEGVGRGVAFRDGKGAPLLPPAKQKPAAPRQPQPTASGLPKPAAPRQPLAGGAKAARKPGAEVEGERERSAMGGGGKASSGGRTKGMLPPTPAPALATASKEPPLESPRSPKALQVGSRQKAKTKAGPPKKGKVAKAPLQASKTAKG